MPSTDGEPLILLRDVRKTYNAGQANEAEVLHGLDLRIDRGEFVALMGPSGSGKSTLLNILGLLERMTAGSYQLLGEEMNGLRDEGLTLRRRQTLGFVFQFHHLLPAFTALENVTLPTLMTEGRVDARARAHALALLKAVGLAQAGHKRPAELSGGMQQRVAIARAVALSPALVLADEPTGNLDPDTSQEIMKLLINISKIENTAVLMATHDYHIIRTFPSRIIKCENGLVHEDAQIA